jgi:UDP-N-acetylmuramoyl-L-alanyl-D-glutamate--2,6-diaminopimelate ligase
VKRPVATTALLAALPEKTLVGTLPASITGVAADSRRVAAGDCFVAVPGFRQDARAFVRDAAARGASLVVTEGAPLDVPVTQVLVPSARVALARLADAYYDHPSRRLTVVGITGTNGKTTTSYLVDALLRAGGGVTGVIGTVGYVIGPERREASQTTPEALEIQAMLARLVASGARGCAMEVSSHALVLARVEGIHFDVAVFTNLTQDHLDFHGSLEEYGRAKRRLFELLERSEKPRRVAVVNADDPASASMVRGLRLDVLTYGVHTAATVRGVDAESTLDGIRLRVDTPQGPLALRSPLVGGHNVENLLAAVACGLALDLPVATIAHALSAVTAVPGRFEQVRADQPFLVVVDYAHTPDALERVLATARKLTQARLGVVFGCGGDRDRGKRPIMGEIAVRLADAVWVTSDNPRSEEPQAIIDEVLVGVRRVPDGPERCATLPDRQDAIRSALGWARPDDTVVIAGKGHETYQILGAEVVPFDDREVARRILGERLP